MKNKHGSWYLSDLCNRLIGWTITDNFSRLVREGGLYLNDLQCPQAEAKQPVLENIQD